MAKSTVDESDGKRKREEERDEVRRELAAVMAKFAVAELACSEVGAAPAALLDRRLRSVALEMARQGLGVAYGKDDTAPGRVRTAAAGRGCRGARRRRWKRCWAACGWRWRGGRAGSADTARARASGCWAWRVR